VRARSEAPDVTTARDGVALREAGHSESASSAVIGVNGVQEAASAVSPFNDELLLFRNRCTLLQARVLELQRQANEQSAALRSLEYKDDTNEIALQVRDAAPLCELYSIYHDIYWCLRRCSTEHCCACTQEAAEELSSQLDIATAQLDRARQQLSEAAHENTTLRNLLRDSEQQLTTMADLEQQFAAMKRKLVLLEDDYAAAEQEWEGREQSLQVCIQNQSGALPFPAPSSSLSISSAWSTTACLLTSTRMLCVHCRLTAAGSARVQCCWKKLCEQRAAA
jgi:hypothetical protein